MQFEPATARLGQPCKIPFDVRQKHRHALRGEAFSHDLQGDGFTGAGCTCNKAVPVGVFQLQPLLFAISRAAATDENLIVQNSPRLRPLITAD